jgi:tRNA pseudouridine55 synthase
MIENEPDVSAEGVSPPREKKVQKKREKRDVHGWIILDKPVGMTSTHAVAVAKRLFSARRVGHAGTLDPLASGILPLALGEATKTVPFVMDGRKRYRFTVRWGEERDTDDAEGQVVATSAARPDADAIRACLGGFTGTIAQVPPKFSAIIAPAWEASPARSRRCRRNSRRSRSRASAPMTWRVTARR